MTPEFTHDTSVLDVNNTNAQVVTNDGKVVVLSKEQQMRNGRGHLHGMFTLSSLDIPQLEQSVQ